MLKAGIIGCGEIAGGYDRTVPPQWSATHAGAYYICPATTLVAAADPDKNILKAFQKKWGVQRVYEAYENMLTTESLDLVSICLPTHYHFAATKSALLNNVRAVFLEKPIARTLNEAQALMTEFEDRTISVNYFRRWNTSLNQFASDLKNDIYGLPVQATIRYTKGIMVNGSHLVDMCRWFFGEPVSHTIIRRYGPGDDPGIDFFLRFEKKLVVYFLHVPDVDYVFVDVDILTEKGRCIIGQRGQLMTTYDVESEPYYQKFNILKQIDETETGWRDCSTRAIQELVDCIYTGEKTSCTLEDGFKTFSICHQILSESEKFS